MEIPYVVNPRKDTGLFNSKIAIWLFLASEVMLFGGLFSAYIFLRLGADYPWPERTLPVLPGLINTFILIASSVTVVFAWASLKMRQWGRFQIFMGITVACAAIFMVFKGIEYNVKFHHQAARLNDYTAIEGHIDYFKVGGDDHGHGDHGDHEPEYLLDAHGHKIEANRHNILTSSLTFDLARMQGDWVEDAIAEATTEGVAITLAEDFDLNAADSAEPDEDKIVKAGTPLSLEVIDKLKGIQLDNHAENSNWRIRFNREAWRLKKADIKRNDLLGEAAFAADYPKGAEAGADERDEIYARWKAGMRARLATEVSLTEVKLSDDGAVPVLIKGKSLDDVSLPEKPTVKFTFSKPMVLRLKSHDVINDYEEGSTSVALRDNTVVEGKYEPSPMNFHYVDGIDFQHLVMIAEEKDQDPIIAIESSWLIKNNPEVAELWEMHKGVVEQLEDHLAKKDREPTHKDRYRMGWQEIAFYMDALEKHTAEGGKGLPEIKIGEKAVSAPKVTMTLKEHFMGPDYHNRKFPHVSVPRAEVALDSKFTPKWNTYYAIYFTITGLHGLHVVGGAIVLAYYLFCSRKMYQSNPEWLANRVEVGGLFWHFVDLVWIFAFPIFYLM
ncbi:cytochrome c oxidase subunit III [Haloferula helveola]|uniref:Cytochrome c oxidase subunit III n=1 Tax=Haloferula helveola TaxID=490095 RepID=A0ABN6H6Q9_9BACT|nr:cytochrome c oxidase subunit III [Haloferula helveola]